MSAILSIRIKPWCLVATANNSNYASQSVKANNMLVLIEFAIPNAPCTLCILNESKSRLMFILSCIFHAEMRNQCYFKSVTTSSSNNHAISSDIYTHSIYIMKLPWEQVTLASEFDIQYVCVGWFIFVPSSPRVIRWYLYYAVGLKLQRKTNKSLPLFWIIFYCQWDETMQKITVQNKNE